MHKPKSIARERERSLSCNSIVRPCRIPFLKYVAALAELPDIDGALKLASRETAAGGFQTINGPLGRFLTARSTLLSSCHRRYGKLPGMLISRPKPHEHSVSANSIRKTALMRRLRGGVVSATVARHALRVPDRADVDGIRFGLHTGNEQPQRIEHNRHKGYPGVDSLVAHPLFRFSDRFADCSERNAQALVANCRMRQFVAPIECSCACG